MAEVSTVRFRKQSSFKKNESWRINYIEGEVTPAQKEDMDLLMKHSEAERKIVNSLKNLRNAIKSLESLEVPDSEEYHQNFTNRIMSSVSKENRQHRGYRSGLKSIFKIGNLRDKRI